MIFCKSKCYFALSDVSKYNKIQIQISLFYTGAPPVGSTLYHISNMLIKVCAFLDSHEVCERQIAINDWKVL